VQVDLVEQPEAVLLLFVVGDVVAAAVAPAVFLDVVEVLGV